MRGRTNVGVKMAKGGRRLSLHDALFGLGGRRTGAS